MEDEKYGLYLIVGIIMTAISVITIIFASIQLSQFPPVARISWNYEITLFSILFTVFIIGIFLIIKYLKRPRQSSAVSQGKPQLKPK